MLDYAANAVVYWPVEGLKPSLRQPVVPRASDPKEKPRVFLDALGDLEAFWGKAKTNLQAGKVRILFLADKISAEHGV